MFDLGNNERLSSFAQSPHVFRPERKEFFTLLYSNRVCTIGLENGETSRRIRKYGCHFVGDHERRWPLTWTLSRASVMVPSRGNGSVHIPREAARSNVLSGSLLNQMEVTINDDEARN